jgi:hypothetical protein
MRNSDPLVPYPVAPDWTLDIRCPHGRDVRVDLDIFRSLAVLDDPCPAGKVDRERKEAERLSKQRFRLWREARKFRRGLDSEGRVRKWLTK